MEISFKKIHKFISNCFEDKTKPEDKNETRIVNKFLIFPKIIKYKLKWLTYATYKQRSKEIPDVEPPGCCMCGFIVPSYKWVNENWIEYGD